MCFSRPVLGKEVIRATYL